jgi:hypothetical protein
MKLSVALSSVKRNVSTDSVEEDFEEIASDSLWMVYFKG